MKRDCSGDVTPSNRPRANAAFWRHADRAEVDLVSDRSDGPYAGTHRSSALDEGAGAQHDIASLYCVAGRLEERNGTDLTGRNT